MPGTRKIRPVEARVFAALHPEAHIPQYIRVEYVYSFTIDSLQHGVNVRSSQKVKNIIVAPAFNKKVFLLIQSCFKVLPKVFFVAFNFICLT